MKRNNPINRINLYFRLAVKEDISATDGIEKASKSYLNTSNINNDLNDIVWTSVVDSRTKIRIETTSNPRVGTKIASASDPAIRDTFDSREAFNRKTIVAAMVKDSNIINKVPDGKNLAYPVLMDNVLKDIVFLVDTSGRIVDTVHPTDDV